MKQAALLLTGRYLSRDFSFYRSLCRGKYKIAVDGGVKFFEGSNSKPDMIIGDFDSTRSSPGRLRKKYPKAEIVVYPKDKDRTDCHLAIDLCLERGMRQIDIVQPNLGELDHLLGNLMLLDRINSRANDKRGRGSVEARLIGPKYEVSLIDNRSVRISDRVGWGLSIIPLSKRIKMSVRNLKFPASELAISRGDSRPLRNLVTKKSTEIKIEGQAFMILLKP